MATDSDLQGLADELATAAGYEYRNWRWCRVDGGPHPFTAHPFPIGDITHIAAAWPEGWDISIDSQGGEWRATAMRDDGRSHFGWGPSEWKARARLLLKILKEDAND